MYGWLWWSYLETNLPIQQSLEAWIYNVLFLDPSTRQFIVVWSTPQNKPSKVEIHLWVLYLLSQVTRPSTCFPTTRAPGVSWTGRWCAVIQTAQVNLVFVVGEIWNQARLIQKGAWSKFICGTNQDHRHTFKYIIDLKQDPWPYLKTPPSNPIKLYIIQLFSGALSKMWGTFGGSICRR